MTTQRHTIGAPQSQGGQFRAHQRAEADDNMLGGPSHEIAAAQDPTTPAKKLTALSYSKSEDVRIAVAGNPSTPVRDLIRMLDRGAAVAAAARANPALAAYEAGSGTAAVTRRPSVAENSVAAASDPTTDGQALDRLSYSRDNVVRSAVASNPGTPVATLLRLAGPMSFYRAQALANPSFPADEALRIAGSVAGGDHLSLLRNRTLPAETIDAIVRRGNIAHPQAAAHPNVSARALRHMTGSDNPLVLAVIARNSAADPVTRDLAAVRRTDIIERQALARDIAVGTELARRDIAAEAARVERNRRARERRVAGANELVSA